MPRGPIRADRVTRSVVIGELLIEKPANTSRQPNGKVLIEGTFEMKLDSTLVVRHGVERVECRAERSRDFDAGLQAEESIGPLDVERGPVQASLYKPVGVIIASRRKTGQGKEPIIITLMPAKNGAVIRVADAGNTCVLARRISDPRRSRKCLRGPNFDRQ